MRFHPLTVTEVRRDIRDAVVLTLAPRDQDRAAFAFIQGQYLTFRRNFSGTEVRRSYSICSGKDEGILQVGIKKVEGGAFSTWANEELRAGMTLDAMVPMGRFFTPITPDVGTNYVGFAGGSGITPISSIMKTVLAQEPKSTFTLVYSNRSASTTMFREELEALKNRYMQRLKVFHVLTSGAQISDLFAGRVDAEKCSALFEHCIDIESIDTAFICGPEQMMLNISAALRAHGLADDQIKFELFASAQHGRLPREVTAGSAGTPIKLTEAMLTLDGETRHLMMNNNQSILDAALENSLDAPYACKAGVCSTCKCKVIEGRAEMLANHALDDDEVARGYVLSCQAYPLTDKIIVDYDQH